MNTQLLIAIVSGIVSIIAAIIAFIQSLRTARLKATTALALEELKADRQERMEELRADREKRKEAFQIARQDSAPVEQALAQAWQNIQIIKEVISTLVARERYDADLAPGSLRPAVAGLLDLYHQTGMVLRQPTRLAWQKALACGNELEELISKNGPPQLASDDIERLRGMRVLLSGLQMDISDGRQRVREELVQKALGLM
jgi:hypothetical protein